MNWSKITWLALSLFIAQVSLGFMEGAFAPTGSGISGLLAGHAASFVVCAAIFFFFSMTNSGRPFIHAWLGLLLQVLVALLLSAALAPWLGSTPWALVVAEWVVLVVALAAGTSLGIGIRHRVGRPADA